MKKTYTIKVTKEDLRCDPFIGDKCVIASAVKRKFPRSYVVCYVHYVVVDTGRSPRRVAFLHRKVVDLQSKAMEGWDNRLGKQTEELKPFTFKITI